MQNRRVVRGHWGDQRQWRQVCGPEAWTRGQREEPGCQVLEKRTPKIKARGAFNMGLELQVIE